MMFVCLRVYLIEAVNDKLAASKQTWSCAGGTALSASECADARLAPEEVLPNKSRGMKGAGVSAAPG